MINVLRKMMIFHQESSYFIQPFDRLRSSYYQQLNTVANDSASPSTSPSNTSKSRIHFDDIRHSDSLSLEDVDLKLKIYQLGLRLAKPVYPTHKVHFYKLAKITTVI